MPRKKSAAKKQREQQVKGFAGGGTVQSAGGGYYANDDDKNIVGALNNTAQGIGNRIGGAVAGAQDAIGNTVASALGASRPQVSPSWNEAAARNFAAAGQNAGAVGNQMRQGLANTLGWSVNPQPAAAQPQPAPTQPAAQPAAQPAIRPMGSNAAPAQQPTPAAPPSLMGSRGYNTAPPQQAGAIGGGSYPTQGVDRARDFNRMGDRFQSAYGGSLTPDQQALQGQYLKQMSDFLAAPRPLVGSGNYMPNTADVLQALGQMYSTSMGATNVGRQAGAQLAGAQLGANAPTQLAGADQAGAAARHYDADIPVLQANARNVEAQIPTHAAQADYMRAHAGATNAQVQSQAEKNRIAAESGMTAALKARSEFANNQMLPPDANKWNPEQKSVAAALQQQFNEASSGLHAARRAQLIEDAQRSGANPAQINLALRAQGLPPMGPEGHAEGGAVGQAGYASGGRVAAIPSGMLPDMSQFNPQPQMDPQVAMLTGKYRDYTLMAQNLGIAPVPMDQFVALQHAAQRMGPQVPNNPAVPLPQGMSAGMPQQPGQAYAHGGHVTPPGAPQQYPVLPPLQGVLEGAQFAGYNDGGAVPVAGRLLKGPGTGTSDSLPAVIDGDPNRPAALSSGEYVIPARVVKQKGTEFFDRLIGKA